jgi:DNA-binding sugar fermentation-stimulating protein
VTTERAKQRKTKVHKRVYITEKTNLMLTVMNTLMQNDIYDEFVERCILYGLAYINDSNKINMNKWTSDLKLPSLKDVEEYLG